MYGTNARPVIDITGPFKQSAVWENEETPTSRAISALTTDSDWVAVKSITGWRRSRALIKVQLVAVAGTGSLTYSVRLSSGGVAMAEITGIVVAQGATGVNRLFIVSGEAADDTLGRILHQNPKLETWVTANTLNNGATFTIEEWWRYPVAGA